jgi:phenylacetic acid degradation operon negative regulatory protein
MASTRNTATPGRTPLTRPTRRLTARSAIASTLLGVSPPELPTRSLVATVELLGIAPGTARVAMSRMVAAGELAPTERGYRLVGRALLARQSRQSLSREGPGGPWSGRWRLEIVHAEARPPADRAELRAALAALRHAELREGVWLRPDNLPDGVLPDFEACVEARCTRFRTDPEEPVALAASLWDLAGWAGSARDLQAEAIELADRLDRRDTGALAPGFSLAAQVLRHLQADPLLPHELTPPRWPGPELRATYDTFDAAFKDTLSAWLRTQST